MSRILVRIAKPGEFDEIERCIALATYDYRTSEVILISSGAHLEDDTVKAIEHETINIVLRRITDGLIWDFDAVRQDVAERMRELDLPL